MDYSISRRINVPDRVSTEEIKSGLERIRKAQEEVLEELRKNHQQDQEPFKDQLNIYGNNNDMKNGRIVEAEELRRELEMEKQKSTEKSSLYRRRVVDLQSSLAFHEQTEDKLKRQVENKERNIGKLAERVRELQAKEKDREKVIQSQKMKEQKFRELQNDYSRLLRQAEKSNNNVRMLEQQIVDLKKTIEESQTLSLKAQLQRVLVERDSLMNEKVQLLRVNSKLESENIRIKHQCQNLEKEINDSQFKNGNLAKIADILVEEVNKINEAHEDIFSTAKEGRKLGRDNFYSEEKYQNSLARITEILEKMQQNNEEGIVSNLESAIFQEKVYEQTKKVEQRLLQKFKVESLKLKTEKESYRDKIARRDIEFEQLKKQNLEMQTKINRLKQQKKQNLEEITSLTKTLAKLKNQSEENIRKRSESELFRQQKKEKEYVEIINELSQQMDTIKKQKKDLDFLLKKISSNQNRQVDDEKTKKRINEILLINEKIKGQNERIKDKYQSTLVEKQNLYLQSTDYQRQIEDLNKRITIEILEKEKINSIINNLRRDIHSVQRQKEEQAMKNDKMIKQLQKQKKIKSDIENGFQNELEGLRNEIEISMNERQRFKELRANFEILKKENEIISRKSRQTNEKVDHLWSIKQVEYKNVNDILAQMRPI